MEQALTGEQISEVARALEDLGYSDDQIDVALGLINQKVESKQETSPSEGGDVSFRAIIKTRLLEEKDWRKRASLAALLISHDL